MILPTWMPSVFRLEFPSTLPLPAFPGSGSPVCAIELPHRPPQSMSAPAYHAGDREFEFRRSRTRRDSRAKRSSARTLRAFVAALLAMLETRICRNWRPWPQPSEPFLFVLIFGLVFPQVLA